MAGLTRTSHVQLEKAKASTMGPDFNKKGFDQMTGELCGAEGGRDEGSPAMDRAEELGAWPAAFT